MDLGTGEVADQCILQRISQSHGGSLQFLIELVIAHADIEVGLFSIRVQNDKYRRVVGGDRIKDRSELICYRLAFFIDHLVDVV